MSRAVTVCLLALWLTAGARPSSAQSLPSPAVELHQFHGSPFSDRILRLDGTGVLPEWKLRLGFDADYGLRPLVVDDVSGAGSTSYALVRHSVGVGLRAALGLGHGVEVAALVP